MLNYYYVKVYTFSNKVLKYHVYEIKTSKSKIFYKYY